MNEKTFDGTALGFWGTGALFFLVGITMVAATLTGYGEVPLRVGFSLCGVALLGIFLGFLCHCSSKAAAVVYAASVILVFWVTFFD